MNEEEFQKQKIEKREKIDTILAYVILGILVFSIIIITYLKFVKKSDAGDEYTVTYATISDVASGLNNSNLGVTAAVTDRAINITKDNFDITVSLINNNELEFKYSKDNKDMVTSIYKEVLKNLCVFYGNSDSECTSTVNAINEESNISGIRFLKDGDNTNVYINILSSISLPDGNKKVYNEETITDVSFNDYELKMSDVEVILLLIKMIIIQYSLVILKILVVVNIVLKLNYMIKMEKLLERLVKNIIQKIDLKLLLIIMIV